MTKKEIFGTRLKQARQKAGLSMEALCKKMNNEVSKQTISKYESGKVLAGSSILIKLAEALNVDLEYFFRPFVFDLSSIKVSFRKKSNIGNKEIISLKIRIQEDVERFLSIEKLLGVETPPLSFSMPSKINTETQMKSIARQVREKWNLGCSPISCVKDLLMLHGIKVFEVEGPEGFDGISGRANGNVCVIVINKSALSIERIRFTLMHELAHLIANSNFDDQLSNHEKEKLCHVFASEMLLPASVLEFNFGNKSKISFPELIKMQIYFGISIDAIMYSLKGIGVISDKRHRSYCISKNVSRDFKNMVETSRFEEPKSDMNYNMDVYYLMIYSALAQNLISPVHAAELLRCNIYDLPNVKMSF